MIELTKEAPVEKISLPIGVPPVEARVSGVPFEATLPRMEITPCLPTVGEGITLYRLDPVFGMYKTMLQSLGFELGEQNTTGRSLPVVFQLDNTPTESFTNDYSPSFLQQMTEVISAPMQELMYIANVQNLQSAIGAMSEIARGAGAESIAGWMERAKGAIESAERWAGLKTAELRLRGERGAARMLETGARVGQALLTGSRVDWPNVWKSSAFGAVYSITVRLMCPDVKDDSTYARTIIGPLAALLLLAVPQSTEDSFLYRWPFIHKVKCPGLFNIKAAAITNISVSKGGDQAAGGISWMQRPWIVDVRIDFTNLYNVLVSGVANEDIPNVKDYIDGILDSKSSIKNMYVVPAGVAGSPPKTLEVEYTYTATKYGEEEVEISSRVSPSDLASYNILADADPIPEEQVSTEEETREEASQLFGQVSSPTYDETQQSLEEQEQLATNAVERVDPAEWYQPPPHDSVEKVTTKQDPSKEVNMEEKVSEARTALKEMSKKAYERAIAERMSLENKAASVTSAAKEKVSSAMQSIKTKISGTYYADEMGTTEKTTVQTISERAKNLWNLWKRGSTRSRGET